MKLLATCILISSFYVVIAQKEKEINQLFKDHQYYNSKEFAYLKPDKRIYYSGESLDFDAVLLNQYFSISDLSKIIHIDLVHETQETNRKFIFRLESGQVKGRISIPQDIPTGNYQMVAYTHFMRNYDTEVQAHRVPIYIQNVLDERTNRVAKEIQYQIESTDSSGSLINENSIEIYKRPKAITLEIQTPSENDYYLVSEGLKSVQLIAKLSPTGPVTKFALPTTQFKSGFQRFILLNSDLEVVSIHAFYLESDKSIARKKFVENKLEVDIVDNLISKVVIQKNGVLNTDSLSLFKRMYRLFYNIPLNVSLESLSYRELIDDTTLLKYSKYSFNKWKDVLKSVRKDSGIKYFPEKNIRLSGRVIGDSTLIAESNIAIHLFENQLDITKRLALDGTFSVELILPSGQDYFKASVLNNDAKDVSDKVEIVFEDFEDFSYNSNLEFYPKEMTDDIFKSSLEFKYILSTYSTAKDKKWFFWDNIKFDKSTQLSDYYKGIENFEEFIKEAVMNVSVAEKQGQKILKMYNYSEGNFDRPQLIILDNKVLANTLPLFQVPLDSIESIKTVYNEETLRKIGKNFVKGIIVVKTKSGSYKVSEENLDPSFKAFTGYTINVSNNEVSDQFQSSTISDFTFGSRKVYELDKSILNPNHSINLESFSREGIYNYSIEKLKE